MYNKRIAEIFYEIADMIELEDEKRIFEVRAYRKAALALETMQEDVGDIIKKEGVEGLMKIPGIGKGLADKIKEFVETGRVSKYEASKKKYPIDFTSLTKIQGLGSKRAFKLYKMLGIKDIEGLKKAVEGQKIRILEGFGEKSEQEIGKGLAMLASSGGRMSLGMALPEAESIIGKLRKENFVERAELAGSARRMKETVGDLDILIISERPERVMEFVTKMREVDHAILKGPTKTTVWLKIGLSCDIRVVEKKSFGAAMQYFIGNKDHNIKLRQIAIKKGYKLSEYGLFDKSDKVIASDSEKEIYKILGLDYMEPEMREDRGEIELALQHKIPRLVSESDIRGDLHTHTNRSDGANTLEEMADAAIALKREYIGITDHSKSEYVARGMDDNKFAKHLDEIEMLADKLSPKIRVLKSAETDILKDGSLDLSARTLERMDYVLASIHTNLNMGREEMTKRMITATESGYVDIIGHPTDRLINERQAINLDLDKVFEAAKENNVIMEIDSFPDRLDLNDENIMKAKRYGLKFSIDTDSHSTSHLTLMRYGIGTAKRGWLRKEDVINTLNYEKLANVFKRR